MAKEGNGNGVSYKIAWTAIGVIGFLVIGIFTYTFNKANELGNRIAAIDTKIAVSDEKIEVLTESVKELIETSKELEDKVNDLTIGVNSCKDIKRKLRRTLNE